MNRVKLVAILICSCFFSAPGFSQKAAPAARLAKAKQKLKGLDRDVRGARAELRRAQRRHQGQFSWVARKNPFHRARKQHHTTTVAPLEKSLKGLERTSRRYMQLRNLAWLRAHTSKKASMEEILEYAIPHVKAVHMTMRGSTISLATDAEMTKTALLTGRPAQVVRSTRTKVGDGHKHATDVVLNDTLHRLGGDKQNAMKATRESFATAKGSTIRHSDDAVLARAARLSGHNIDDVAAVFRQFYGQKHQVDVQLTEAVVMSGRPIHEWPHVINEVKKVFRAFSGSTIKHHPDAILAKTAFLSGRTKDEVLTVFKQFKGSYTHLEQAHLTEAALRW